MLPGGLTEADYEILEFLAERDMVADPKTIAANTRLGHDRVKNRLKVLLDKGFLQRPEYVPDGLSARGLYETTEIGQAYAEGDKTISELRSLVADREGEKD